MTTALLMLLAALLYVAYVVVVIHIAGRLAPGRYRPLAEVLLLGPITWMAVELVRFICDELTEEE